MYAICQRSTEKLNAIGEAFGIEKRYSDYDEMLKDPNVDAVHINSPIPNHAEQSLKALYAGKHVASEHNVAAALRPALASARLAVIGECTPAEWARVELRDVAFARAFVPLRVEDPAPEVLRAIAAAALDDALGRRVSRGSRPRELDGAVEAARQLVERYMPRASALGASLQLLRRTAARARARPSPGARR
jgi:hypothetical protein